MDGDDALAREAEEIGRLVGDVLLRTARLLERSTQADHPPRPEEPTEHDPLELMSIAKVARLLDVSKRTVEKLIYSGELKSRKIGGTRRIARCDVERLINGACESTE